MQDSAKIAKNRLEAAIAIDRAVQTVANSIEYTDVPSSDAVRMGQIFGVNNTAAGVPVTEYTAMRVSAVYACVRLISGAIPQMPCQTYQRQDDGSRLAIKHDYWWLLNEQPCPLFTAASMWEYVTAQVLLRGDAFVLIQRKGAMSPLVDQLIPLRHEQVTVKRVDGRLRYLVQDEIDGKLGYFAVDQDDMLHFPGCGFDGCRSLSVIGHAARQAIGTAIRADEFAGNFYGSGAQLQYVVKAPASMSPELQEEFRQAFVAKYGAGSNPGTPLILTEGLDITSLSMNAADAQLLESRKFQVIDIARAFGVPPFMIGETEKSTSWGSGIEQMGTAFVIYTLGPHLRRFEQELNRKLFRISRNFVEFNRDGLTQGDLQAQAEYFKAALGGTQNPAWMTQNEVRKLKNLPPIAGGDELHDPTTQEPDPNAPTSQAAA
jgi:HK97 family phage portal protein